MLKIILFLIFCVVVSCTEITEKSLGCGRPPKNILSCLRNPYPYSISMSVHAKCENVIHDKCEYSNCIFRERHWFDNEGKIDRVKIVALFKKASKEEPWWKSAFDYLIPTCLEQNVPPQSVYLDCPTYDISYCMINAFIQKSSVNKWSTTPECAQAREFAASGCSVCTRKCSLALDVPINACNACNYNTNTSKINI